VPHSRSESSPSRDSPLLPNSVAGFVSAWASGRIIHRLGARGLVAAGGAAGFCAYSLLTVAHGYRALAVASLLLGIGWGATMTAIGTTIVRHAQTEKTAIAVAVNVVVRQTAVAAASQVTFALINSVATKAGQPVEAGYTRAFAAGATVATIVGASAALLPRG
jgi:predicted MFS family arabinose efflux permease